MSDENPIPRYAQLDVWMALGGEAQDFERWRDAPNRTFADAWAQLLAAVRGDLVSLFADSNPPADDLLALVSARTERSK